VKSADVSRKPMGNFRLPGFFCPKSLTFRDALPDNVPYPHGSCKE
jgi:hypothetical protein